MKINCQFTISIPINLSFKNQDKLYEVKWSTTRMSW